MEKYGVDVEQAQKKEAAERRAACPQCGVLLPPAEGANVPKCDNCGTKPFEKA